MYASGQFDFPTGTGDYSVTGLGFKPQGVILIGSNKATSGSLLTGLTGPGLFVSLNALDWSDPTNVMSFELSPNGRSDAGNVNYRGIETGPISMQTDAATAAVVDYKASAISFDFDGFTITVSTAAPGVRPVHWFAWGGPIPGETLDMQTAFVKQVMTGSPQFDAGFEAQSVMALSTAFTPNGFGEGFANGVCWFSFGTAHYPTYSGIDAQLWQSSTIYTHCQTTSPLGAQGFTNYFVFNGPGANDWDTLNVADVVNPLGPVLVDGFRRHRPAVPSRQVMVNVGGGEGGSNFGGYIWWTSEGWTDFVTVPAGGSVTVQAPENFEEFEQVMFSTINGGGSGQPLQVFGTGMLGVDDQGCVVFGKDGSFYQSNTECIAHCTAGGYSAASGVINGPSFTLTSTNAALGNMQVIWHGWGRAARGWMPQMYRWWPERRGL